MSPARVLIPADELRAGVRRLAAELSAAYDDGVVLVAVLKGSVPFQADLVRALTVAPEVDFLAISSYAPDTGRVRIVKDLDLDIAGRDVVLVEDIVDTGLTLTYVLGELARRGPRSLEACALLDKATRRIVPTPVRFLGFTVGDDFVVGYGLDFAERYRNLDLVAAGDLAALRADPDAHVDEFYAR
ncbi:MAG: hypoxanthine phosphoribosyltransferase [Acidimicrobiia bacterium]